MYYYNYYFDCTKVCDGEGVCLSDKVSCYSQSYVSAKCAYTNDVQIRIPILIPHSLERLEPCHAPVIARAA